MKNSIKLTQLFLLLVILTSCQSTANKEDLIKDSEDPKSNQINMVKRKMEVRLSLASIKCLHSLLPAS